MICWKFLGLFRTKKNLRGGVQKRLPWTDDGMFLSAPSSFEIKTDHINPCLVFCCFVWLFMQIYPPLHLNCMTTTLKHQSSVMHKVLASSRGLYNRLSFHLRVLAP